MASINTTTQRRALQAEVLVALGLASGPVVALGFTRFAYALLLPAMREDLSWSFAAAGGINTANALGYIAGCLSATWWARRFGIGVAFVAALGVSALMLLLSAATGDYVLLTVVRAVGGVSTAIAFVLGSALAARVHTGSDPRRSALLVAVYMAGVGIGIVVAGVLVPIVLELGGGVGWRLGWLVMGVLSLAALAPATLAVRRVAEQAAGPAANGRVRFGALTPTFVWYVLFGAGYVAYLTFVIALLAGRGLGGGFQAVYFVVLGVASAVGTLVVWGPLAGRLPRGRGPALASLVVLVGVLPVLVWSGPVAAIASGIVFGSSFMAGPTAATVIARRSLPAAGWTLGIALLTSAFSAGQAIGPLAAGLLSDTPGGITLGLWLSVVLLGLSVPAALLQRDRSR
ncbi:YbfB/YjiJ family MFS transporter [Pseudonocardia kujensis]|uniref:YbfB/YjiJ family MFS transporter n=1 Tax=Pseudonocardia kujensis TaxID=1128675 RepID=UPI001E3AE5C3|nr:YbfB/YjiJ family MFS transporter [Pseudonocardia kujensis]MCE0766018.1 YbfB/YjiJ family MFS transporter [Pseudonocardia kujensis]